MNAEMKERDIDLVDLIVEILLHWRFILIAMLLGGILLGGFSYIRSSQDASAQQMQLEQAISVSGDQWETKRYLLEKQLTEAEINEVTIAFLYGKVYEEYLTYHQRSVLMQMDPLHVQKAEIIFLIQSDDIEKTYNIKKVYESLLVSPELYNYVKEQCSLEDYVNELIIPEGFSHEMLQQGNDIVNAQRQQSDTVTVQVVYSDADTCQAIAGTVIKYIQQKKVELVKNMGEHDVVLLSQSQGEVVDTAISQYQKTRMRDIDAIQSSYMGLKKKFSAEELQYYNCLVEAAKAENLDAGSDMGLNDVQKERLEQSYIVQPKVSIKYVILGMIFFALVYSFIVFMQYILNRKIRIVDNLQKLYNIPQLGMVTALPRKYFLGTIDQYIMKLRWRNQRKFGFEESKELAIAAVKIAAKKENIDHVCVVGCDFSKRAHEFCGQLKETLKEENILIEILDNILYDAEAMEKLENMKSAVVVEVANSTLYEEVVRELQLLSRQNIYTLGGILIE